MLRTALSVLMCSLALLCTPGWAHPYHTSFAEMEWNSDGTELEVSLRVLPEDFEQALSWHAGKAITLEQQTLAKPVAESYLNEHFQLVRTDRLTGSSIDASTDTNVDYPLTLEGYEVAYDETWLYFVIAAPRDASLTLRNSLMMDVNDTQTNRVQRLWREPSQVLVFTAGALEQPL